LHELKNDPNAQEFIETSGFSVCGNRFRLATLKCPVEYLYLLSNGDVRQEIKPVIKLSKAYNLLSKEERAWTMGAIYGRAQCFVPASDMQFITTL